MNPHRSKPLHDYVAITPAELHALRMRAEKERAKAIRELVASFVAWLTRKAEPRQPSGSRLKAAAGG